MNKHVSAAVSVIIDGGNLDAVGIDKRYLAGIGRACAAVRDFNKQSVLTVCVFNRNLCFFIGAAQRCRCERGSPKLVDVCSVVRRYLVRALQARHVHIVAFRRAQIDILSEGYILTPIIDHAEFDADNLNIGSDKFVRYRRLYPGKFFSAYKRNTVGNTKGCKNVSVEIIIRNGDGNTALDKTVNDAYVSVQIKLPRFNPPCIYACI